jgi:hypothetical protein
MNTMKSIQYLGVFAAALILVACGGGSSNNSFGGGGTASLSISSASGTVTVNPQNFQPSPDSPYTTQVTVQFRAANGQPVADGTSVTLSSSSAARGVVSPFNLPTETGSSATAGTAGGRAEFWFTAGGQSGTVTLTASAANPAGGAGLSAVITVNVVPGDGSDDRLSIVGSSSMPTNEQGVPIFFGSPFINELNIRFIGANGEAGQPVDGQVGVAIAPVTTAAFSTLDDPETDDVNEFFVLLGNGPVNMAAGVATIFVHSSDQPGPVTVTVSAVDSLTSEQFTTEFVVDIQDGAANFLPAQLQFSTSDQPVYIQGSGGNGAKNIQLFVDDSGDNPVPDPEASGTRWNNVRLQLEQPTGAGARLSGTSASGPVSGTDILVSSVNGVAAFSLETGTEVGPHRITATVDRADNNMDNALVDALSAEFTVEVGDGQLFALELDNPLISAIRINRISNEVITDDELILNENGIPIPPDPDGTYSLNLTVQGTDRVGNPVLPGTQVAFGNIDAPLTADSPPSFVFSGPFADPEEAGDLLTVVEPEEGFLDDPLRVDEAVEPGDTLVMFGKVIPGNREHEAARFVESVLDEQSIVVTQDFNSNSGTGQIVDDGAVIPWAIGRSQVGVIDQLVTLGDQGRGTVRLSYPVGAIGSPLIIWSQGSRPLPNETKSVADVEAFTFPGIAPLVLTATPNQVSGNQTVNVTLCLRDGIGSPVSGVFINAAIGGGTGSASIDGTPLGVGDDRTADATGPNGCLVTALTTQGVIPGGDAGTGGDGLDIVFFVGSASDTVTAVPSGSASLSVAPSRLVDQFQGPVSTRVTLTLRDAEGNPISSVPLTGECESPAGGVVDLLSGPGITDQNGETTALILVNLFDCDTPVVGEFQCTFTTSSGSPVGTFTAVGLSEEDLPIVSPPCD